MQDPTPFFPRDPLRRVFLYDRCYDEAATDGGVLHATLIHRNDIPELLRILEAGIQQRIWPTHCPPIYPLLVRTLHHGCAALSSAPKLLKHAQSNPLAGQIDGNGF